MVEKISATVAAETKRMCCSPRDEVNNCARGYYRLLQLKVHRDWVAMAHRSMSVCARVRRFKAAGREQQQRVNFRTWRVTASRVGIEPTTNGLTDGVAAL